MPALCQFICQELAKCLAEELTLSQHTDPNLVFKLSLVVLCLASKVSLLTCKLAG
jgi:hypothetical protein